jgi:hypothetical protein
LTADAIESHVAIDLAQAIRRLRSVLPINKIVNEPRLDLEASVRIAAEDDFGPRSAATISHTVRR